MLYKFTDNIFFTLLILPAIFLLLLLPGCSPKTAQLPFEIDTTSHFSNSGTTPMPDEWWQAFQDTVLNNFMDSALQNNFDVLAAWERLQAADALARRASSGFFPDLEAFFQADNSKSQFNQPDGNRFSLGLNSSYEIDLWGRIRSQVQAEKFRADASLTDYQAATISLSAQITRTWFHIQEAESQLQLIHAQVETNEKTLALIRNRFGIGQVRGADILRQQQLLEATIEQRTYAEARLETLENQLAVLIGKSPQQDLILVYDTLPALPPLPETGLPVDLIKRRPDVQSAWYRLQAADRDLAAAISNRYPRLSINASVSASANNIDQLFNDWAYSVAGNILAPIFYGGELKAEMNRNEAVRQESLYQYGNTVLLAFREVEDALIREQKQQETIVSMEKQIALSNKTLRQLRSEYLNGMSGYLDVLAALDEHQRLRRDLLTAKLTLLEYRIALYTALAGSFDTDRTLAEN